MRRLFVVAVLFVILLAGLGLVRAQAVNFTIGVTSLRTLTMPGSI